MCRAIRFVANDGFPNIRSTYLKKSGFEDAREINRGGSMFEYQNGETRDPSAPLGSLIGEYWITYNEPRRLPEGKAMRGGGGDMLVRKSRSVEESYGGETMDGGAFGPMLSAEDDAATAAWPGSAESM